VYGRQAFAILLFQDLAAIPLIAAVPLLGGMVGHDAHGPDIMSVIRVVGTIFGVIVGGRLLLRHVFRFVARAKSTEVFTATALLVVMGTAWLMELAGISTTLGAFLAGLLLADSEYRHELESNIEPFKGLLLGLFFVSVGMSVDLAMLVQKPLLVLGMVALLLAVKAVLIMPLGKLVGALTTADSVRLAAVLACGGEFAFVILNLAQQNRLITDAQRGLMVMAISLSMALTPLLVLLASRLVHERVRKPDREFDAIEADTPRVIIAGFGRMGQIVARVLRAQGIQFVALESSVEQVETSRRFGGTSLFFGDPGRPEMLRAAQADKAEVFVIATDDPEANLRTARLVRRQYPHLKIVARARNRQHTFRLMDIGVEEPVRETFYSSLEMTRHVLESLGLTPDVVESRIARFRKHDDQVLRAQYLVYDDETALVQTTKEALHDLQQLFEADAVEERVREEEK
ncbi:MAG TPA: cation:proton antiporter, partial [Luteibacter sp.]|nr:cation:proton antiporter [Luteibacter sp.]